MSLDDFPRHFATQYPHRLGGRILVALSGGPDSVALIGLLRDPLLELRLEAAHVHHGVRGPEADEDAEFCRRLCDRLGVPFHLERLVPGGRAPDGREAAWRRRRYRALVALRERCGLDAIATAHHRDDVAEGVLLQLLRGGSPRAMAGIAPETPDGVIRPLLPWSRAEIVEWLVASGESWREDSSNRDLTHLRNRVRHVVLPCLRTVAPRIETHLAALAQRLAEGEAFMEGELQRLDLWIDPWHPDGGIPADGVRSLGKALRDRWLHAQAARAGIGRVSRRQLELFDALLRDREPRAVALAGRWRLRLAAGRLWLEPPRPVPPYSIALEPGAEVALPLPGWRIAVDLPSGATGPAAWRGSAPAGAGLTVRSPLPGDRVEEEGRVLRVSRLIARRTPRHLRAAWPVVCVNDTISWIPGVWREGAPGCMQMEVRFDGGAADRLHR